MSTGNSQTSQAEESPSRLPAGALRVAALLSTTGIVALYLLIAWQWGVRGANAARDYANDLSHVEALALAFKSVFGAGFFLLVGGITVVRSKPTWRQKRIVGWVLPFAVLITASMVARGEPREVPLALGLFSCALVIGGTLFTFYALRYLGRNFAVVSDVRTLVTSGPYGLVRHPLYLGEAVALLGFLLTIATPFAFAAFTVSMVLQVWRAKVEEQALATVYPEYHAYAARTPMMIPLPRFMRSRSRSAASTSTTATTLGVPRTNA